jgi:hypothetical protein
MDGVSVVDISTATTKQIIFRKPDKTLLEKTASFVIDGTDGKLKYTTIANDLDINGKWNLQVRVVLPTGDWHSDIYEFTVHANL